MRRITFTATPTRVHPWLSLSFLPILLSLPPPTRIFSTLPPQHFCSYLLDSPLSFPTICQGKDDLSIRFFKEIMTRQREGDDLQGEGSQS